MGCVLSYFVWKVFRWRVKIRSGTSWGGRVFWKFLFVLSSDVLWCAVLLSYMPYRVVEVMSCMLSYFVWKVVPCCFKNRSGISCRSEDACVVFVIFVLQIFFAHLFKSPSLIFICRKLSFRRFSGVFFGQRCYNFFENFSLIGQILGFHLSFCFFFCFFSG